MENLIEMVTSSLSPEQIERSASTIDVPSARLRSLLPGAVAAVIAVLAHRMSTPAGKASVMQALPAYASPTANRSGMLDSLLGQDHVGPVTDVVAKHAGVSRAVGGSILTIAATAVVGVLANLVASHRLGAGGLGEYLGSQHSFITGAAPMGLAGALGLASLEPLKHQAPTVTVVSSPQVVVRRKRSLAPLYAALAALGLLALGAFFLTRHVSAPELPTITSAPIRAPVITAPKIPQITTPVMPTPAIPTPSIPAASANPIDAAFGAASTLPMKLPLGTIEFPFASATPTDESMPAIDALAGALKAHPGAKVRLDGYTDAIGKDDVNQPLSSMRADAVRTLLQDRGIDADRVMTSGHSEKAPVADNASPPGRAENRRVEATLLAR
jgi:outer membrane protein OmpA-like peptidoglycan-associated protein